MMEILNRDQSDYLALQTSMDPPWWNERQEYEEFMVQSEILQIVFEGLRFGSDKLGCTFLYLFFWETYFVL